MEAIMDTEAIFSNFNKQPMSCEPQLAAQLYKHFPRWTQ